MMDFHLSRNRGVVLDQILAVEPRKADTVEAVQSHWNHVIRPLPFPVWMIHSWIFFVNTMTPLIKVRLAVREAAREANAGHHYDDA